MRRPIWSALAATALATVAVTVVLSVPSQAQAQNGRPAAPAGVAVFAGSGQGEIDVIWTAHPNGAKDYRVSWAKSDENFGGGHTALTTSRFL